MGTTPASADYSEFRSLMKKGRFREAALYAERASVAEAGSSVFWLTQQAHALNRAGRKEAALGAAEQALRADPANLYAVIAAADALLGMGKIDESLQYYEEATHSARVSARAHRGCLDCLSQQKRWQAVLDRIAAWDAPPEEKYPWQVQAYAGQGNVQEALRICEQWLERSPHHAAALWALVDLEVERDGMEAVLQRYAKLVKIPSLPDTYGEIYASLCRRAGKPELAVKVYRKIKETGATSRIHKKEAFALAKANREEEAIPLLEELLRSEPGDMYLHSSYAAACKRIGQIERSINFYNSLLTLHPEERHLYGRMARLRQKLENQ